MSYNVYLEAPRVVEVYESNMTSNISGMWFDALNRAMGRKPGEERYHETLGALGALDGCTSEVAVRHLRLAAKIIHEDEHGAFSRRNPENGWGNHMDAGQFLVELADAWEADPDAKLRVSR